MTREMKQRSTIHAHINNNTSYNTADTKNKKAHTVRGTTISPRWFPADTARRPPETQKRNVTSLLEYKISERRREMDKEKEEENKNR